MLKYFRETPVPERSRAIKNTIIFVVFVLAVIGFLYAISGKRSPRIPENGMHRGISEETACLDCHGARKYAARKETHPPKDQCFICHKRKRTTSVE